MSHVFAFPNPNSEVTYGVFLKILKPRATSIFQIKARYPCTVDGDITTYHDTCIG